MEIAYKTLVLLLLATVAGMVYLEGERIQRAMPAGYSNLEVQDVRVLNRDDDPIPVAVKGAVRVNGGEITNAGRLNQELPVKVTTSQY